ncbi:MAG: TonB-dependent receptor, partial [Odoribacter sp.]|nr:TonB-dependent receptor [Odoribacter sp.]
HADYTYNNLVKGSLNLSVDGSSSSGVSANRFGVFPSAGITLMAKNSKYLINSSNVNRLNIRAEYGLTGNSRFSANYGKNYYQSALYQTFSGIVRSNIPNTNLKWETNKQLNLGLDFSFFRNRLDVSFDYYDTRSSNVVFDQPISSVYGSTSYYDNSAKIKNNGIELSLQASLIYTKDFEWIVGGNIAILKSKVTSLGSMNERIITLSDGAQIITRVGENPYNFYGYEADGVFSSTTEASAAGLTNTLGQQFGAGDIHFKDINNDHIINEEDKVILGSATPDFFGGFYTSFRYKGWGLSSEFTYSYGNDAYNAVRRSIESMDNFNNQSKAVLNRWQIDGQKTDMPRAVYGDPMDNNRFSSRWIEDASYLKIKNITLSYSFNKPVFNFFRSGTLYVTGENLHTFTKYLGLDPEFAYSYTESLMGCDFAKVANPRSIKFGINLKF